MEAFPDFRDLLATFNDHHVEYLVVGAHAVAAHGFVRATKDLDVWVHATPENAPRVMRALAAFGAPLQGVTDADFAEPGAFYRMGVPPVGIDVLTSLEDVDFDEAWSRRGIYEYGGVRAPVLSRELLVRNKRAVARAQDLADVERLEKSSPK